MITNGHPKAKDANVVSSLSEFAHDVVELGELQAQLLKLDVEAAWRRMRTGLVLAAVALCLFLGCIPVLLLCVSEALTAYAGWPRALSLLAASGLGILTSAGIGWFGWRRLQQMLATFERSRDELNRNVAWIKTNLRKSPTPEWERADTSVRA